MCLSVASSSSSACVFFFFFFFFFSLFALSERVGVRSTGGFADPLDTRRRVDLCARVWWVSGERE